MKFSIPGFSYSVNFAGDVPERDDLFDFSQNNQKLQFTFSPELLPEKEVDAYIVDIDQYETLTENRKSKKPWVPVIAYGPPEELPRAFEYGCTDYLKNPWSAEELYIRVAKSVRSKSLSFSWGRISISPNQASSPFGAVKLSIQESTILKVLAQKQGDIVPRDVLYNVLWGKIKQQSRVVDMHISSLRKKIQTLLPLELNENPIKSAHGRGYFIPDFF